MLKHSSYTATNLRKAMCMENSKLELDVVQSSTPTRYNALWQRYLLLLVIENYRIDMLTCVKYESIRRDLLKCVDEVCSDDAHCSSLSLSASLFLSPWLHNMTDSECSEILAATFQFIYESARHP